MVILDYGCGGEECPWLRGYAGELMYGGWRRQSEIRVLQISVTLGKAAVPWVAQASSQ